MQGKTEASFLKIYTKVLRKKLTDKNIQSETDASLVLIVMEK